MSKESSRISSFKYLYSLVFKNDGDLSKVSAKVRSTPLKCYVKESSPYFLVTDDFFYVPCYFTKKAIDQFKSQNSNVNVTDLKSRVIFINEWSLELARVKSEDVFTSYAGVELKLIVNSFKVEASGSNVSLNRYPMNIYRDNEMKSLINQFVYSAQSSSIAAGTKSESLPDISKFSGKANVSQGVVKFAAGDSFTNFGFKDSKTSVLDSAALHKLDKGTSAAAKDSGRSFKPKVVGKAGLAIKKKSIKKSDVGALASRISKYTPGGKGYEKKSTARVGPKGLATPGDEHSAAATTDVKTMRHFKKMVAIHKRKTGKV